MTKQKMYATPIDLALGRIIRAKRKEVRVTQKFVADAIGISFQQIQKYEMGIDRMSVSRFVSICMALKLSCGDILQTAIWEIQDAIR